MHIITYPMELVMSGEVHIITYPMELVMSGAGAHNYLSNGTSDVRC